MKQQTLGAVTLVLTSNEQFIWIQCPHAGHKTSQYAWTTRYRINHVMIAYGYVVMPGKQV